MEHTLGACSIQLCQQAHAVLILVLVEHTLGEWAEKASRKFTQGLNPCFSGTYSRSWNVYDFEVVKEVLILVLVEHTLGEWKCASILSISYCLNPCFSGTYSRSIY